MTMVIDDDDYDCDNDDDDDDYDDDDDDETMLFNIIVRLLVGVLHPRRAYMHMCGVCRAFETTTWINPRCPRASMSSAILT